MRRVFKVFYLSLLSFLVLVLITTGILFWFVLPPQKLTPIVLAQSERYIPYPADIGEVELTLGTFPQLGIKVSNFTIISPSSGAPCDTLLKAGELIGVIDFGAFWKNREIIINKFILSESYLNLFTDSLGQNNYGLFLDELTTGSQEPSDMELGYISLENIEFKNLNVVYTDLAAGFNTSVNSLAAKISGVLSGDNLSGYINMSNACLSFEYDGEKYLEDASIQINTPVDILVSRQLVHVKDGFASLNGLGITIDGSIEYDTSRESVITDISYQLNPWQIEDIVALIPPVFLLDQGIEASGIISSTGTVRGIFNDSLMPSMDIHLALTDGNLIYEELPFPLSRLIGEAHFYYDPDNAQGSFLSISHFEANSPDSEFGTHGRVNRLFDDMHFDLVTDANILLDEFNSFIPANMKLDAGGRISGQVKTDFTMSQAENLLLDKMNMSGSVNLYGFSMIYDSLSMSANKAKIDFSLPNPGPSDRNTGFAFVKIASDELVASMAESFRTTMKNAHFFVEMSDVRDSTIIPDLFCTFSIGSLLSSMDTLEISIDQPLGYFTLSHVPGAPLQPAIQLACNSYKLNAIMGRNSIQTDKFIIKTEIINDRGQEDIFLQWLPTGSMELRNGTISMPALSHPLDISAIKMDFDPEIFNIHESCLKIDRSDFGLTGVLNNVHSWFRGDSLLRGDFSFVSGNTDLVQIMKLTNGIGMQDDDNNSESLVENPDSGPYMVPLGIDILLRAQIDQANFGSDTATNIAGDVRVSDGVLVLDGLTFTTPAAGMQLTAMYRTPRKNHLYLGIDYHMLDVEISRLLQMIPDIDTLMPMLRSFDGRGEFHIAVETYLDSLYNIKKSTLRGASSIRGQDLVLMDGETFSEIARTLRFSKRAENRVDSLSAEFTIFREEIDIYPFLMVMDRYKAVVAGRHNFDMSFNYHISLVESPLPIRLGIDITGTMDDMRYRLAGTRYAEFYRPASRRAVESRQLELRRMIREALIKNITE